MWNYFFNEIDGKTISKLFFNEFIEKNFEIFLQSISLKKKIRHFRKIKKKNIFVTKKRGGGRRKKSQ